MKNIKDRLLSVFQFSQKEMKGLTVLLVILAVVMLFPVVQKSFLPKGIDTTKADQIYLDSIVETLLTQSWSDSTNQIDPNTLSYFQWMDLGVSSDLANSILRTKRKQKQFNCLDEIKAIKGVDTTSLVNYYEVFSLPIHCPKVVKKKVYFEINTVTKKKLASIDGVSYKIASRIIKYRNKLGGFYAVYQLKEVHELTNKEYAVLRSHLRVNTSIIARIKINFARHFKLKNHPYLTSKQASTIINYRKKIKRYKNIEQFKKVYGLTEIEVKRLVPYLSFE
jgi:competence protein ComEA